MRRILLILGLLGTWLFFMILAWAQLVAAPIWITFSLLPILVVCFWWSPIGGLGWSLLSCIIVGFLILRGVSGWALTGPWVALILAPLLIWASWLHYRKAGFDSQRNLSHFQNRWSSAQAKQKKLQSDILREEDSIQEIGRLFGISKRFLGTLNLQEALEIIEEVLVKEFPSLSDLHRHQQIEQIRSDIDNGRMAAQALTGPLPGIADARLRERWWIVSGQLALGLQRISRYRQVQDSATHDGLTGLMTRRYFIQRLDEEVGRALRRGLQLAFLMIDLDYFKNVNDTYGHLVGDVVLREIASRIETSVREIDLVARYGGEEFAVALPEVDPELAIQVAERIRETVESEPIQAYDELVSATVSIGIALCPDEAKTRDALVEQADQAMYQAKNSGRNRTVSSMGNLKHE